ncbi:MAG: adenylate/guanylate cyclase domain-containing protein [Mycobacterium sp.]|nr:MAG: adenylate/guanylate cyclase domain-containing protein [Mycobacterium sp.]
MDVDPVEDRRGPSQGGIGHWLRETNRNTDLIALIRRARRALPGDPEFGDPLSTAGDSSAQTAARAADRLMNRGEAASRELGLGALQVWQAISEKMSGRADPVDVTLAFTDLVGFSEWSLSAGDDATLRLLRRLAQVTEAPLLDAGGQIVKRMGDGMMAVFTDAETAVRACLDAHGALKSVDIDGYTPRMRVGLHTGRPQRIGADWLGVDVNIAARVMERAARGGVIISQTTLDAIPASGLESLGVEVKRLRRPMFAGRQHGVPPDLAMYRLKDRRDTVEEEEEPDGSAP